MIKKKISELPECTSFKGLWTIGVDISVSYTHLTLPTSDLV